MHLRRRREILTIKKILGTGLTNKNEHKQPRNKPLTKKLIKNVQLTAKNSHTLTTSMTQHDTYIRGASQAGNNR